MTLTQFPDHFDDFPSSPLGSMDATELYESFLQFDELARNIPKKQLGSDPQAAMYDLLQEVHSARKAQGVLYRKKVDANEALMRLWLSRVRQKAQLFVTLNEVPPFTEMTARDLVDFARLSVDVGNLLKLHKMLLNRGIVLVLERAIPGMKLDGVVFSFEDGHPVIGLSLRYSRLDIFWFTLMHELAHIVLHHHLLSEPILEDLDNAPEGVVEAQADRLARDSLISRSDWRSSPVKYSSSEANLRSSSAKVGVHPSITAGRLQRELGRSNIFVAIINEVNVRKVFFGDE
jgi:HTH-type transcriptional regulator / antitoxin HigA